MMLVVVSFLIILVIVIAPSWNFVQAAEVKSDELQKNTTPTIKKEAQHKEKYVYKVGPLPGTQLFYEKDVANASWSTKGSWAIKWIFRHDKFDSSWPIYGYQPQAIIEKCGMVSNRAKQYVVGFSFMLPTDKSIKMGYFGFPLKASAKSMQWKQLAEFAPKLAKNFSTDVKPGEIQLLGTHSKSKIIDVLDKTAVEKFAKIASTNKFIEMYAKHAKLYADYMKDTEKIYGAFTLANVCKISMDLAKTRNKLLIGTQYPVLDVKPTKRFVKDEKLVSFQSSGP